MDECIHIVCLDAPAPPDYGGAIDMFYKVKALYETGKKIILHYFDYSAHRNADSLKNYCTAIYAYKRKSFVGSLPALVPYIIQSRINKELIDRLNADDFPVVLEGLHCAGMLPFLRPGKKVILRMHNEESSYYYHLAKTEKSFFKRLYFFHESRLLERYQRRLNKNTPLACLSLVDLTVFQQRYGYTAATFIPCFLPWQQVSSREGHGQYCLYHGNLSVSENEEAAGWLIQNVFSKLEIPLLIAGKGISKTLSEKARQFRNISIINNPSMAEIDRLVTEAQINVLPSLNNTGVKLKLLNALLNGRHCITNTNGIKGSQISSGVIVADTPEQWTEAILFLMQRPFTQTDKEERNAVLALYDNKKNAERLNALYSRYR